ncbi:MAG: hypothetical protein WAO58_11590 [Fimbriimonadaceae bacterium]
MLLRYAILCDYANITNDGKVNIFGVMDRIFAPQFPAIHRAMFLIMSVESEHDDEGQTRAIDVQLIDPDAQIISRIQGQVVFGPGKQMLNQIHAFQDVVFQGTGAFQFNILFDEQLMKTLDLELVQVQPQQPA